jgi:hypothetical protein
MNGRQLKIITTTAVKIRGLFLDEVAGFGLVSSVAYSAAMTPRFGSAMA